MPPLLLLLLLLCGCAVAQEVLVTADDWSQVAESDPAPGSAPRGCKCIDADSR